MATSVQQPQTQQPTVPGVTTAVADLTQRQPRLTIAGPRKAAILLASLGNEASATLLRTLNEEEVHDLTRELSLLSGVTGDERTSVLHEFLTMSVSCAHFMESGGIEYATSVLVTAFGPEAGKRMADRLMKSLGNDMPSIDTLRKSDPQQLAKVVHREHPQTIALILSHLGTSNAARLLTALPADVRIQVVRRIALLEQVSPDIANQLAKTICTKLRMLGDSNLETFGGVRAIAEVLNRVEATQAEEILTKLGEQDQVLSQNIRQLMFVFEDLINMNPQSLRQLQTQVDRKALILALKGTSAELQKHFTSLMSERSAEMFREDSAALGAVRIRDVIEAQQQIIATARRLQSEGAISLQAGASEALVE